MEGSSSPESRNFNKAELHHGFFTKEKECLHWLLKLPLINSRLETIDISREDFAGYSTPDQQIHMKSRNNSQGVAYICTLQNLCKTTPS
jgi:hypothetical protein